MKRFRITSKGYKWDKLLSGAYIFIVLLALGYIAYLHDFDFKDSPIVKCSPVYPAETCLNPIYELEKNPQAYSKTPRGINCKEDWCSYKYLAPGIYGKEPPYYIRHPYIIAFFIVVFFILINHLLNNRDKRFIHFGALESIEEEFKMYRRWLAKIGIKTEEFKIDDDSYNK